MIETLSLNRGLDEIPFSAFEELERKVASSGAAGVLRLHQGKTTFAPCVPADPETPAFGMRAHEHAPPGGVPTLRRRIAERYDGQGRIASEDDVVVTGGSTQAIATVLHCVLQPGDEVLLLAPQWLFAAGLVAAAGARPVEVPVFLELLREPSFDLAAALEAKLTARTRAIYFNTPNNPTGVSLTAEALELISAFAKRHGLFILSDNAYENFDDSAQGFIDIAELGDAGARTFSIHTLSKTYAMPGYRVGWVVAPPGLGPRLRKWSLYSIYSLSTAAQAAAFGALSTEPAELMRRRAAVRAARELVARSLRIPSTPATGGLYTFLDLSAWPGGDADAFSSACIAAGVTIAPGIAFGRHCRNYARLCYTAVDLDALPTAIDRLNRVYGDGLT